MNWTGVIPAITTPFKKDFEIDHVALGWHARWMIKSGCKGIVALGSLGEGATLQFHEKIEILQTLVKAMKGRAPVVAGISSLCTREAVLLAKAAEKNGCAGLMVLPPYVYASDWREMKAHVSAIIGATKLSCMLYNNPPAYKTDFVPAQIAELARAHKNLHAVKESSGDVRRITAIRAALGTRLNILVGMDDAIVEGVRAGADGWIAGLVNAFPTESVKLFEFARDGKTAAADKLYKWFLPLLRMDTVVKFVQLIKLVEQEVGVGTETVRPPRLLVEGDELKTALETIAHALKHRPKF
jgi:4-hydroxy-tetrahydrodipicolinate synthase